MIVCHKDSFVFLYPGGGGQNGKGEQQQLQLMLLYGGDSVGAWQKLNYLRILLFDYGPEL